MNNHDWQLLIDFENQDEYVCGKSQFCRDMFLKNGITILRSFDKSDLKRQRIIQIADSLFVNKYIDMKSDLENLKQFRKELLFKKGHDKEIIRKIRRSLYYYHRDLHTSLKPIELCTPLLINGKILNYIKKDNQYCWDWQSYSLML